MLYNNCNTYINVIICIISEFNKSMYSVNKSIL